MIGSTFCMLTTQWNDFCLNCFKMIPTETRNMPIMMKQRTETTAGLTCHHIVDVYYKLCLICIYLGQYRRKNVKNEGLREKLGCRYILVYILYMWINKFSSVTIVPLEQFRMLIWGWFFQRTFQRIWPQRFPLMILLSSDSVGQCETMKYQWDTVCGWGK